MKTRASSRSNRSLFATKRKARIVSSSSLLLVILLIVGSSIQVCADVGGQWYMNFDLRAVDSLMCGQPVTLQLTLSRNKVTVAKAFSIRFESFGNISLLEKDMWQETLDDRTTYSREIHVIVPCGDTSGLLFRVDFGNGEETVPRSFVPLPGGVKMILTDARLAAQLERERAESIAKGESIRVMLQKYDSTLTQTMVPESRSLTHEQVAESLRLHSDTAGFQKLPGGGWARTRKMTKSEIDEARMRVLEREPCPDRIQNFFVDGKPFVRYQGEYKFHPGEALTMEQWNEKFRQDRLKHPKDTTTYEILIEIRDSVMLARVKGMVKLFAPSDKVDTYRVRLDKSTHHNLEIRGIKCTPSFSKML